MIIIKIIILYFIQIRHTDDFPSTGTRLVLVMELIGRKISTADALRKIMYADDLVIVAEHLEELQGALEEWNDMFKKRRTSTRQK